MLELGLLLLLLQVEYFQSPGLSRQYSLLALDAEVQKAQAGEEGEDRKAFFKKKILKKNLTSAYSLCTYKNKGRHWVGEGRKPTVELSGFVVCVLF